jgi:hypothetical protein
MRRLEQRMQGTDVEAEMQGTERHQEEYLPCSSRLALVNGARLRISGNI